MNKPINTEIAEMMGKHSELCALYGSAIKWDWLRRQKAEDVTGEDIAGECASCFRNRRELSAEKECSLNKAQKRCCDGGDDKYTLYQKVIRACFAKDQQAFTQNANDLYYLIMKLIEEQYGKGEPKMEKTKGFEPTRICCYEIGVTGSNQSVTVKADLTATEHLGCVLVIADAKKFSDALQSAIAYCEKKCGNCNHWFMERNGECGLEVHHNKSYRFDSKACKAWAEVPGANEKPAKKEVFYHIGQRFNGAMGKYLLSAVGDGVVMMMNDDGCYAGDSRTKVGETRRITEDEFEQICSSGTFTLIE